MSVKIKICGITNVADAQWAASLGVDYIGLNFVPDSPRKVSPVHATEITVKLPPFVLPVGVFAAQADEDIQKIVRKVNLKGVQLHDDRSPEALRALGEKLGSDIFICKAFRLGSVEDTDVVAGYQTACRYFLLDARVDGVLGGSGQSFPWDWVEKVRPTGVPIFLAGGLTPANVADAVEQAKPFAVDVASGVEKSPKRKDYDKMRMFIEAAKGAS